jgi:hypothetical protein
MKNKVGIVPLIASLLVACGDPEDPAFTSLALLGDNALSYNALNLNELSPNELSRNALSYNSLDPTLLGALQAPGTSGDLTRQLIKYAVSCALTSTQSFSFTWVDGTNVSHNETYWGDLGIEPDWGTKPLSLSGQGWVSSCLIARVNWYERPVTISARGQVDSLRRISTSELQNYPHEEGAFWGNLFTSPPVAYACYHTSNIERSRSQYRDCAAGHADFNGNTTDCGIIRILGSCDTYCTPLAPPTSSHTSCTGAGSSSYATAITVFLP